jgi:hypothetical protein
MQQQQKHWHALEGGVSSTHIPASSASPSSSRLAPVSSAINGILTTQPSASAPPDSSAIAQQILAALQSVELASPRPATGNAVDTSGDSPGVFVMRMPPATSEWELKELAAAAAAAAAASASAATEKRTISRE